MPIYLCREGHKHRSQEGAVNCGYCKALDRKLRESNRKLKVALIDNKKQLIEEAIEYVNRR